MKTIATSRAALLVAVLLAAPAGMVLAQPAPAPSVPAAAPAAPSVVGPSSQRTAISVDEAAALLAEWGFVDVRLDDVERDYYEFDVRDADGREIEVEVGFDGVLLHFDVDDERRATGVDLSLLLPEHVRRAALDRGIVDIVQYELEPTYYEVEGFTEAGDKIEIEVGLDARVGAVSVESGTGPGPAAYDEARVRSAVEAAGYHIDSLTQRPRHVEIAAINPEGEQVTLHVDFDGTVYRERLVR